MLGEEFATELNSFYRSNPNFVLVWSGTKLYAKSETEAIVVNDYRNYIPNSNSVTADDIQALVISDIVYFDNDIKMPLSMAAGYAAGGAHSLGDIYMQKQSTNYSCWAAAMACIVYHYNGTKYTDTQIMETVRENTGIKTTTVTNHFSEYYNIACTRNEVTPTNSTIISEIDADDPIYGDFQNAAEDRAHSVIVTGYDDRGTSLKIILFDPDNGKAKTIAKSGSNYTLSYPSISYTFEVYLKF